MRFTAAQVLLLGALIGVPFQASARPCPDGKCVKRDLLPRIEIPGIPLPKPIAPIPKPIDPGLPNVPGRMPEIPPEPAPAPKPAPKPAPEPKPAPAPKPADPKPAGPACKRAGGPCPEPGDAEYTFSGRNYPEKGRELQAALKDGGGRKVKDWGNLVDNTKFKMQITEKTAPQLSNEVRSFLNGHGLKMGHFMNPDRSWTRYEIFGKADKSQPSVVDVYISTDQKAMLHMRRFRDNDKLWDIPKEERPHMSEFIFQLWRKAMEGKGNVGDLKKIVSMDIDNTATQEIIKKAKEDIVGKGPEADETTAFTVKPQNEPAFSALSASSSGVSNYNMLIDHIGPSEFNHLKPIQADVSTAEQKPAMIWTFGH
ncbi:hypothetical protein VTN00DRAFT_8371 [Thermoascus crustaceus]|uniref:uncharacterized protein n=1 Tax=Thermoascus crustaceus TaxID=5088 RepID=UPI0037430DA6